VLSISTFRKVILLNQGDFKIQMEYNVANEQNESLKTTMLILVENCLIVWLNFRQTSAVKKCQCKVKYKFYFF